MGRGQITPERDDTADLSDEGGGMKTQDAEHLRSGPRQSRTEGIRSQLSGPLVTGVAAMFVFGIVVGGVTYLQRSPEPKAHVDGTAAWLPHLVAFVLSFVVVGFLLRRRRAHPGGLLFLAPVAAQRLRRTVTSVFRHPTALLRLLIGIVPLAMLVYLPFRIGVQILAGLDPNFTVNAWGGPSYLGAMACHYLDAALLMAAAAGLLNLLLLPAVKPTRS